jgi:hypothetical protein
VREGQHELIATGLLSKLTKWSKFYHEVLKVAGDRGYIEAMGWEYFHLCSHLDIEGLWDRENLLKERYRASLDTQAFWWFN